MLNGWFFWLVLSVSCGAFASPEARDHPCHGTGYDAARARGSIPAPERVLKVAAQNAAAVNDLEGVRKAVEAARAAAEEARKAADEARAATSALQTLIREMNERLAAEEARIADLAAKADETKRREEAVQADSGALADQTKRAEDAARAAEQSAAAASEAAKAAAEAGKATAEFERFANQTSAGARIQDLEARLAATEARLSELSAAAPTSPTSHPIKKHKLSRPRPDAAAQALTPLRAYLASADIPPPDIGGYGLVALQAKPTDATRSKLLMVCRDFLSFFPTAKGSTVPAEQQMLTIWPIESSFVDDADKDDCDFELQHYDLIAAETAMADARRQGAKFDGEGPYLIGWAPSDTRGVPDKLVLTFDLSRAGTQAEVDHAFLFWKQKIVEDPGAWTSGFSMERVRVAIADFADRYGPDILGAIKLVSAKGAD